MLLDRHDSILSDLDGVVYAGPFAIDGAPEALNKAQELGVPVAFVTNNASRSVQHVAEHLTELGVNTSAENVVSSAQAGAELLKEFCAPGDRVLICGASALADCVRDAGFEPVFWQSDEPRAVIQGFNPKIGWEDLAEAAYTLADESVQWIATNTDFTIPKERGIAPGNGTLVGAVAAATGRTPVVAGKPEAPIFHTGAKKLGSETPLVIGDRLDTDIQGGNRAKMATACVMTGVDTYESLISAIPLERPTYIIATLADLFEDYPQIQCTVNGETAEAELEGVTAHATADTLTVHGAEHTDINYFRVACTAWWGAHPNEAAKISPEDIQSVS